MKILYLSKSKLENSVNAVYIKGLRQNGAEVIGFSPCGKGIKAYFDSFKFLKKERKNSDALIIGYESPDLVFLSRLVWNKKLIYNALCSVYERMVISRGLVTKISPKAFYYWLLDFLAAHSADLIMVETENQKKYFKKLFCPSNSRIIKAWTGVDEDKFFYDPAVSKFNVFTVLFRGALMPEAGAEYAIKAAKILENNNIKFIMISGGLLLERTRQLIDELKPVNLEHITDLVPYEKLRIIMQKCHLSLGQLSDHDRLTRTIPHKAYESLAMKLPYLTASNTGILELLTPDETCLVCNPADAESLVEKILWAKENPIALNKIGENGYKLFQSELTSKILAAELINKIFV